MDKEITEKPAEKGPSFKKRKLYNQGKKDAPVWVLTYKSKVYVAPDGFQLHGRDSVDVAEQEDGVLVDREGAIWPCKGENPGCGVRCPESVKTKTVEEASKKSDEVGIALIDIAPEAKLTSIWRRLPHASRSLIAKAFVPPKK